jgi:hypothetical protein
MNVTPLVIIVSMGPAVLYFGPHILNPFIRDVQPKARCEYSQNMT